MIYFLMIFCLLHFSHETKLSPEDEASDKICGNLIFVLSFEIEKINHCLLLKFKVKKIPKQLFEGSKVIGLEKKNDAGQDQFT